MDFFDQNESFSEIEQHEKVGPHHASHAKKMLGVLSDFSALAGQTPRGQTPRGLPSRQLSNAFCFLLSILCLCS
jgi:hypothetical protein